MDSPQIVWFGKGGGKAAKRTGFGRNSDQLRPQRRDQTVRRSQDPSRRHQPAAGQPAAQRARAPQMIHPEPLSDSFGRVMRDLRVSVTDRCNFRCLYCLPETEEAADFYRLKSDALRNPSPATPITREWKPRSQILSFEEIERVVRIAVELGIQKVRLTGDR